MDYQKELQEAREFAKKKGMINGYFPVITEGWQNKKLVNISIHFETYAHVGQIIDCGNGYVQKIIEIPEV